MSENLPATQDQQQPFGRMMATQSGMNAGAVAIEQERAIAEAQGQLILAKKFPRSMTGAMNEFLESCKSPEFAVQAFYSVPNRGSGPSIRFAEEAARCYGNFQYGHRELSRTEGKSEIEVFAWDMQNNNRSIRQVTVLHVRDKSGGSVPLKDQTDIDNRIANVASKQMRSRILALLPKHIVAAGQAMCKATIAGGNGEKPLAERISGMMQAFGRFGVNKTHIETHLGHDVDNTTVDELADLIGIYNAIKEGGKASEYFPLGDAANAEAQASTSAAITSAAKKAAPAALAAAATTTPATKAKAAAAKPATEKPAEPAATGTEQNSNPAESNAKPAKDPAPESTEKPAEQKQPAATTAQKPAAADEEDVF